VAFSRSKFRLNTSSVGRVLQSVLGGSADLFSVVELEQQLFQFSVLNHSVGLHVYALKSFACESFKPFFHLWNPNGLVLARISSRSDSGPRYDWTIKLPKKIKNLMLKRCNPLDQLIGALVQTLRILVPVHNRFSQELTSILSRIAF
jgi:hypothetical protein